MHPMLEDKLKNVLATYKLKKGLITQQTDAKKISKTNYKDQFLDLCDKVINPVFEEFDKLVTKNGDIKCIIDQKRESGDQYLNSVTIGFIVSEVPSQTSLLECPHLTILCDKDSRTLSVSTYNSRQDRPAEIVGLSDLTEDYLGSKLFDLLNMELR